MLRVLLASGDGQFAGIVEKELREEYIVAVCRDGRNLAEMVHTFDPDVMVLDASLPGADIFGVLRGVRNTFRDVGIVIVSPLLDERTIRRFAALEVDQIVTRLCTLNTLVAHIVRVGTYARCDEAQNLRNVASSILLDLNFRLGMKQFRAVCEAVLSYYAAGKDAQMKDVYLHMMEQGGGTAHQKEKMLRDAIKTASRRGDMHLWKMYFPPIANGEWICPTNEEFIARIAYCLEKEGRLKLPYELKGRDLV